MCHGSNRIVGKYLILQNGPQIVLAKFKFGDLNAVHDTCT